MALGPSALVTPAASAQLQSSHPPATAPVPALERDMALLRAMLAADFPTISYGRDDLLTAISLRDAIYENVPLGATPKDYQYYSPIQSYLQAVHGGHAQICGGYAQLYIFALEARGINTRRVGMFRNIDESVGPMDSHVSVEAYINGYWIAMDPTFNVSFVDDAGRFLGWAEIRARILNGETVIATRNNMDSSPNRSSISTYYAPIRLLVQHLSVGVGGPSQVVTHYGWDGILHYNEKPDLDYTIQIGSKLDRDLASYIAPGLSFTQ